MKKAFQYFIVIILFSAWGMMLRNKVFVREAVIGVKENVSEITGIGLPCSAPFEYAIGAVDPQFNLSAEDFLAVTQEAEKIWEVQSGKNLFSYNPNAEFRINLIFDSRQLASNEADKLAENLDQLEVEQAKIADQYEDLSGTYEQKMAKYKKSLANYEKKLADYNEAVEDWNAGAKTSEEEFNDLKEKKETLSELYKKLEKERLEVNKLAGKTKVLASKEKNVVAEYNTNVSTYKNKYGGEREFEKGLYDGKEINLYQFKQLTDLRMTIIHELGHALGIGHLNNPESIMYYLLSDQNMENPILSPEDLAALKAVCKF
jgi:predicted  nucleic acid-binding Zn-ribbon protein